jgi:hypothetical protein
MAVILNASTSTGFIQTADTSGEIVLQNNGTTRLTVNASGVTIPTITATTVTGTVTNGTAVSASGTAVDFTGIPSWAKKITVMFNGVSSNGTSPFLIQMGSGSFENTGYASAASIIDFAGAFNGGSSSSGYRLLQASGAADAYSGLVTIANLSGNTWVQSGVLASTNTTNQSAGSKSFGGVIDRLRITTASGTQAFDAGTINLQFEG